MRSARDKTFYSFSFGLFIYPDGFDNSLIPQGFTLNLGSIGNIINQFNDYCLVLASARKGFDFVKDNRIPGSIFGPGFFFPLTSSDYHLLVSWSIIKSNPDNVMKTFRDVRVTRHGIFLHHASYILSSYPLTEKRAFF